MDRNPVIAGVSVHDNAAAFAVERVHLRIVGYGVL